MPVLLADSLRLYLSYSLLSLFWLCLIGLPVTAQYKFDHWTVNDGLPQNAINAIIQTRDGYLWVATNDGLARFDGVRFTVFNHGNMPGIGGNRFASLYEDREGTLWAGSEGTLIRYRDGVFVSYTVKDGVPEDEIARIEEDERGGLWVSGRKTSLSRSWEGRFIRYNMTECLPGHIPGESARNGLWWSRDERGLHFFQRGRWFTVSRPQVPSLLVTGTNQDQYGRLWIGTSDGNVQTKVSFVPALSGRQPSGGIHLDRKGNQWFSRRQDQTLRRERNGVIESYPAVNSMVTAFYEDREGWLWIGTNAGLFRAREIGISTLTRSEGLLSELTYSVLEDRSGAIWIGTWGGGPARFADGRFTHFFLTNPAELYGTRVTSLYEDRAGTIWIGMQGGMNHFQNGKLTRFSDQFGLAETWATCQDRAGDFWFATTTGLTRLRGGGGFMTYTMRDGLPFNDVRVLLEDRGGALWIGTYGGLARWQDGRFTTWTENEGLSGNRIRCLYEDGDGALWIGTYDGGLTRLKNGRFTHYTVREGLFGNGVFQILEDGSGYFWMSCNQGIFRVRRQELNDFAEGRIASITSVGYGVKDGMVNPECNGGRQPAGWRMRDGKLWFPTINGLAIVDPAGVPINKLPPPVVIEECRLNRIPVPFQKELRIAPDQDNLEIQYTANSFIKPEQVKFKYRLAGMDADWVEAGNRRVAYYSHVPSGDYTFTVIAANSDGVWNTEGVSLKVVVIPPFWRRWWFVSLLCLWIAGWVTLAVRRRFARLRRETARQQVFARQLIESQEHERQRFASELHDSLSQDLILIRNWALQGIAQLDEPSPGSQQLHDISARSAQALAGVKEIIYNLRPHLLEEVKLSGAIKIMFRKASSSSGIAFTAEVAPQADRLPPETQINLYRIVQECVNNIIKHSQATEAQLTIRHEDGVLLLMVRDNGCGFEAEIRAASGNTGSLGLTSITERARMLGGEHEIQSAPGQGAIITVKLNWQEPSDDK
ncbi:MAG TPA: two-component regulator propeller domain-containing protein [Blastocatellia bacterium]